jgi:ribosome maturation factor RimP
VATKTYDKEKQLQEEIGSLVERDLPGVEVLAVELSSPDRFVVYVDHADGVDHALCARVTDALRDYLREYSIDVSSPGIERPLRTPHHFLHFAGSEAKIQLVAALHLPAGDRRNFKGILQGVEGDQVVIECGGTAFRLPIDEIDHARLVPDWDAVMKGKSGVGKPSPRPVKPGHRPSQKRKPEAHAGRAEGNGDPAGHRAGDHAGQPGNDRGGRREREREAQAGGTASGPGAPAAQDRLSEVRNKEQG